jgi:hypothetical protein
VNTKRVATLPPTTNPKTLLPTFRYDFLIALLFDLYVSYSLVSSIDTIFREAVSTKVLTMKAVRGCGRKCRNFQRAYLLAAAADKVSLSESNRISINDLIHSVDPVPHQKLLQIQKGVKTHRNVADFCGKDILCIIKNS